MQNKPVSIIFVLIFFVCQSHFAFGQEKYLGDRKSYIAKTQIADADKIKVFNNLRETVNRLYFDSAFNGNDWVKLCEIYQPQVLAAKNKIELKQILNKLVGELKTSHLNVSFEISLRGKTIEHIFGEKVDYKRNNIIFGYGYSLANFDNQLVVTQVEKDSGAEQARIKTGWIQRSCEVHPSIKSIGDSAAFSETADCVFSTETELNKAVTVSQSWFLSPFSNTQRISKILSDNILYLKFKEFDKGSGEWLKRQILGNSSAKAVIVDLRDNSGGLVDEVKKSLSVFFPPETLIGEFIERDLDEKKIRVGSDNQYTGQIVVLIGGNSFSGAEIFASAFRESERGKVIGQKSGGQVLNGLEKSLSNGFKLYIAFRDYKTVKGIRLEGNGVSPTVEIPFAIEDFRQQRDIILAKALEILKN